MICFYFINCFIFSIICGFAKDVVSPNVSLLAACFRSRLIIFPLLVFGKSGVIIIVFGLGLLFSKLLIIIAALGYMISNIVAYNTLKHIDSFSITFFSTSCFW